MKAAVVPILSGVALAVMAGAGITHFASVRQMVAAARITPPGGLTLDEPAAMRLVSDAPAGRREALEELKRKNASLQQVLANNQATLASIDRGQHPASAQDDDFKRLLTELVAQNRYLRDQIAETNRDLMELQFRVDTHSEQFRPLKLNEGDTFNPTGSEDFELEDSNYDASIGVLPPLDLP